MMMEKAASEVFFIKRCTKCAQEWLDLDQFLLDRNIQLIGYQPHPSRPENGLMLFTHNADDCNTTMAIPVRSFVTHFCQNVVLQPFVPGKAPDCPGFCLDCHRLDQCYAAQCQGKAARQLIEVIKEAMLR